MNEDPNRAHESRRHSVESSNDRLYRRVVIAAKTLFWLALAFVLIQQLWASWWPDLARSRVLSRLQNERESRVIAMIHRQETVNFLGGSREQLSQHRRLRGGAPCNSSYPRRATD